MKLLFLVAKKKKMPETIDFSYYSLPEKKRFD